MSHLRKKLVILTILAIPVVSCQKTSVVSGTAGTEKRSAEPGQTSGILVVDSKLLQKVSVAFDQAKDYIPVSGSEGIEIDGKHYIKGFIQDAPTRSAFLWVKLVVSTSEKQPLSMNLLEAKAVDSGGHRYTVAGLTACDQLGWRGCGCGRKPLQRRDCLGADPCRASRRFL